MDSSTSFLSIVATAICFFMLLRNLRFRQVNKEYDSSSSQLPSSLSLSSVSPSASSHIWAYHVFTSFRGEDIRRDFLSHIQMEFQRMGITSFVDNEIKRGESIAPELIRAIRESKIAVILLSRNYASSKWCLDELVEIMKCREESGQTVMAIFYKVNPSDVKKLTGDFGKIFKKTCAGKTKEDIRRWRQALEKVATIAGYHSSNWDNEAAMIKKITIDISNILINSTPSNDFDGLVGMRAHLEKIEPLLCLDSDEVRMIGIWGPPGIGKTTIARVAYNQLSSNFQLSVFMENIKEIIMTRPCSDDYSTRLQLQQQFMSQITNQKDMKIPHLGVVQDRLKDKKVLVVLDGVDKPVQLDAMAKETWWFGPGSRIIITTQDHKVFRAHGINNIYKVDFPRHDEALEIFCMYAFGQNSPKDGFKELALEVTKLAGELPLGLRVMGSYFRGMSKQEWTKSLPRLYASLDNDIRSILKFSYDALDDEDKDLFLYIACCYEFEKIERVEEHLANKFLEVRQRLNVLAEKSLISIDFGYYISMNSLLVKLGREIVRKQSINEPGQRQFLVNERDICDVLTGDAAGSKSIICIDFDHIIEEEVDISESAFEGMSNLQFLRFTGNDTLKLPRGLNYLSPKLRVLDWSYFPMTCFPSIVNVEFLVELKMENSKLEMLWEGIKPLRNLKWMDLSYSVNLKELPDLSTATNLQKLNLQNCSSLEKLPSSIGNAINLQKLNLQNCSSLIELPSSIGNAINLQELNLQNCSSLIELPSSIGNAIHLRNLDLSNCSNLVELPLSVGNLEKLEMLILKECSKLEVLPTNINLESLEVLDLTDCSMLKRFPEISTNVRILYLGGTAIEEVPPSIRSWPRLDELHMSYFENLKEFPHAHDSITELYLRDTEIQEVPPWIKRCSRLRLLMLKGCKKLVSLSHIPDSVNTIDAEDCESLERIDCSFHNPMYDLDFRNCFKLNQETRGLIIQTWNRGQAILPGVQVPGYFTHRATSGGPLTVKLNEKPFPTSVTFRACIVLAYKGDNDTSSFPCYLQVRCREKTWYFTGPYLTEHLYIFEGETKVTFSKLVFEFKLNCNDWEIGECGVRQLSESEVSSC